MAVYRGVGSYFAATPAWTTMDWQNPSAGGHSMTVAAGDVNGDGRDDLMVRSRAGVMVFAGIRDLGAPLGPPRFRVPGVGPSPFGPAALADVDGDGLADVASIKAGVATLWRSTPGSPSGPFASSCVIGAASSLFAAGDADGDGRDDLVVTSPPRSRLYRGCAAGSPGCAGGLGAEPSWTTERPVLVNGRRTGRRARVNASEPGRCAPAPSRTPLGFPVRRERPGPRARADAGGRAVARLTVGRPPTARAAKGSPSSCAP